MNLRNAGAGTCGALAVLVSLGAGALAQKASAQESFDELAKACGDSAASACTRVGYILIKSVEDDAASEAPKLTPQEAAYRLNVGKEHLLKGCNGDNADGCYLIGKVLAVEFQGAGRKPLGPFALLSRGCALGADAACAEAEAISKAQGPMACLEQAPFLVASESDFALQLNSPDSDAFVLYSTVDGFVFRKPVSRGTMFTYNIRSIDVSKARADMPWFQQLFDRGAIDARQDTVGEVLYNKQNDFVLTPKTPEDSEAIAKYAANGGKVNVSVPARVYHEVISDGYTRDATIDLTLDFSNFNAGLAQGRNASAQLRQFADAGYCVPAGADDLVRVNRKK